MINDKMISFLVSAAIIGTCYLMLYGLSSLLVPSFDGAAKAALLGGISAILAPRYQRYEIGGEKRFSFNWIFQRP